MGDLDRCFGQREFSKPARLTKLTCGPIKIAGAVVNSAAINLGMYITGRVLMGIGISMGLTIAPTLLQEIAHPRYRAQVGSMCTSQATSGEKESDQSLIYLRYLYLLCCRSNLG